MARPNVRRTEVEAWERETAGPILEYRAWQDHWDGAVLIGLCVLSGSLVFLAGVGAYHLIFG